MVPCCNSNMVLVFCDKSWVVGNKMVLICGKERKKEREKKREKEKKRQETLPTTRCKYESMPESAHSQSSRRYSHSGVMDRVSLYFFRFFLSFSFLILSSFLPSSLPFFLCKNLSLYTVLSFPLHSNIHFTKSLSVIPYTKFPL